MGIAVVGLIPEIIAMSLHIACTNLWQSRPYHDKRNERTIMVLKLSSQENPQKFTQRAKKVPKMKNRTKNDSKCDLEPFLVQ